MIADLERAADALQHIDPGRPRDEWIKVGMAAKSAGVSFETFHEWSKSAGNFKSEADCATVWKSFNGSGVTPATLFGMAIAEGWTDPAKTRHNGHNSRKAATGTGSTHNAKEAPARGAKHATSDNAAQVWGRGVPADPADAYVQKKRGTAVGLLIYPASAPPLVIRGQNVAGYLMVPCWEGPRLNTIQFIPRDGGDKLNLPGAQFGAGFFTVGDLAQSARVFIVEGIGQAWAAWKVTGAAAVVTFGAGRVATVAKAVRAKYPAARVVLLPDRGKENQAAAIAADIAGAWCELPEDKPANYDANDYLLEAGADALADLLEKTRRPAIEPGLITTASEFVKGYVPLDYVVDGLVIRGFLYGLTSRPNHGKTTVSIALGLYVTNEKPIAGRETSGGYCLFLAGENPDDFRLRLVGEAQQFDLSLDCVEVLPRSLPLAANIERIRAECRHEYSLVIVDSSAAYYSYDNEDDNVNAGDHARDLRQLTTLPGHPAVIVCCHPTKNADKDNLVPRGGSAFIAELDTNLTLWNDSGTAELSHGKIRGTTFNSINFALTPVTLTGYVDQKGRPVTSIVAVPMSDAEASDVQRTALKNDNRVLLAMLRDPEDSMGEWAESCGWHDKKGDPAKWMIQRALQRLRDDKLVRRYRGKYVLTEQGKKEAQRVS